MNEQHHKKIIEISDSEPKQETIAEYLDDTRALNDYFERLETLRRMSIYSQYAQDALEVTNTMSKLEVIQGVVAQPYRARDVFKRLHYLPNRVYQLVSVPYFLWEPLIST